MSDDTPATSPPCVVCGRGGPHRVVELTEADGYLTGGGGRVVAVHHTEVADVTTYDGPDHHSKAAHLRVQTLTGVVSGKNSALSGEAFTSRPSPYGGPDAGPVFPATVPRRLAFAVLEVDEQSQLAHLTRERDDAVFQAGEAEAAEATARAEAAELRTKVETLTRERDKYADIVDTARGEAQSAREAAARMEDDMAKIREEVGAGRVREILGEEG